MDTAIDRPPRAATPRLQLVLPGEDGGQHLSNLDNGAVQSTPSGEASVQTVVTPTSAPLRPRRKPRRHALLAAAATIVIIGGVGTVYKMRTHGAPAPAQELGLGSSDVPSPSLPLPNNPSVAAVRSTESARTGALPASYQPGEDDPFGAPADTAPDTDTATSEARRLVGLVQPSAAPVPTQAAPAPAVTQSVPAPTMPVPTVPPATSPSPPATPAPPLPSPPVPAAQATQAQPASAPAPAPAASTAQAAAVPATAAPTVTKQAQAAEAPEKAASQDVVEGTFKMVTALAGKVAELARQNNDLQARVDALSHQVNGLTDLDQHLQFAEANAAVQRAVSPDPTPSPTRVPNHTRRHARMPDAGDTSTKADGGDVTTPKPETSRLAAPHYTVQAASPDFAILSSSGGATEIHVGETLPGYGHVTAISMRGENWVVQTEHGVIH